MRYDYTRLSEFIKENNILLVNDYTTTNINIFTIIEGQCLNKDCLNKFSKSFRKLLERINTINRTLSDSL